MTDWSTYLSPLRDGVRIVSSVKYWGKPLPTNTGVDLVFHS